VVIGPAGIGKTRFLAAVEQRIRSAGVDVLRATGAEFERGLAFGGAVQLFEAPLRAATAQQRSQLLEGAARLGGELLGFGAGRLVDASGSLSGYVKEWAGERRSQWSCPGPAAIGSI
jgi:hypothetical protein